MTVTAHAQRILATGEPAVLITITKSEGSTPREVGAQIVVTARGFHGTIGGGTLEWLVLAEAQSILGKPQAIRTLTKSLGPDLGQCCGGRMTVKIETLTSASIHTEDELPTHVNIWGAGHVGRALVLALAPLPFKITWWDIRDNAFPTVTLGNTTCRRGAPCDMQAGFVLAMTHSHSLDLEVVDHALQQLHFTRVGLIGSETKAARFRSRLIEAGHSPEALSRLTCPIGSKTIKSKLPAAIAASVVVQLLQWHEMSTAREIFHAQLPSSAIR